MTPETQLITCHLKNSLKLSSALSLVVIYSLQVALFCFNIRIYPWDLFVNPSTNLNTNLKLLVLIPLAGLNMTSYKTLHLQHFFWHVGAIANLRLYHYE